MMVMAGIVIKTSNNDQPNLSCFPDASFDVVQKARRYLLYSPMQCNYLLLKLLLIYRAFETLFNANRWNYLESRGLACSGNTSRPNLRMIH